MRRVLALLLFLVVALGIVVSSKPLWMKYVSSQDEINPDNISDYYDPLATVGIFNNQKIAVPQDQPQVLGDTTGISNPNKYIEVDLTSQKTYAYENGQKVKEYTISSGTWGRTPNGIFKIWIKIRSQKMSGGSEATGDYYYLPNVPYILFFYNDKYPKQKGYSFHGAYWHNNFGVPMSHGCINMKIADAADLFNWAEVGTEIKIYGKYEYNRKTAMK